MKEKKPVGKIRKFIRTISLAILIIILISVVFLAVALYTADPKFIIETLSNQIETTYSREIEVDEIELSIFKGIALKGIRLSARGGFVNGTSIEFEEGSVIYNPIALLQKKFDIIKITVKGIYTSYDKLMGIIKDFSSDENDETENEQGEGFIALVIREIDIKDSQFIYNNIPVSFNANILPADELKQMFLKLDIFSMYGRARFNGTLEDGYISIDEADVDSLFNLNLGLKINYFKAMISQNDDGSFSINGKTLDISYKEYKIDSYTQFNGIYDFKKNYVEIMDMGLKVNASKAFIRRGFYSINSKKLDITLEEIDANIEDFLQGSSGSVNGNIDLLLTRELELSADLTVSNLKYKFIEDGYIKIKVDKNRLNAALAMTVPGGEIRSSVISEDIEKESILIDITSDAIDLGRLLEVIFEEKEEDISAEDRSPDENEGQNIFTIPPIYITLNFGKLIYDKIELENIAATGFYKNSILSLQDLTLDYLRGEFTASGDLINSVIFGELRYNGGKLKDASKIFLEAPKKLYGTVDFDGKFKINLKDIYSSIAELNIHIRNGEIRDFIIQEEISKLLANIPLDDIFFDDITLRAILSDKTFQLMDFSFDSGDIQLNANGTITLPEMKVDIPAKITISKDYISGVANFARLLTLGFQQGDKLVFDIHIAGPITNLNFSLER